MQVIPPPRAQHYDYLPPDAETYQREDTTLRGSVRKPMFAGILVVALFVAGFGGWAATAPLAGGAVAPGIISPDGSRRTVQHLEGGIIYKLPVRDGDLVEAGAPLLLLEDTKARAAYEMRRSQYFGLRAAQARLMAEQSHRDTIAFPEDLRIAWEQELRRAIEGALAWQDAEVKALLETQWQLFATRREAHSAKKRVLEQRIRQIRQQIRGFEAQLASARRRLEIVKDELEGKEILFAKRLMPKPQVLEVRREQAAVRGDLGKYQAAIAEAEQAIGETELQLVALDAERADEIANELDRVRGELATLKEELDATEDTLTRTVISAPVRGTIVNLRFKTRGGVIQPGEPILDIVPANDDLLIDARVATIDIDVVHAGLPAQIHLTAYSRRMMPQIDGIVRSVSADSLRDDQTGTFYYLARVEVDRKELADLGPDVHLVPGMPAEVLIVTGERTLFEYLLKPFRDALRRSLRDT